MKNIFLILLFPIAAFAQDIQPTRHIEFASRKQSGFFVGTMSVSPKGNMLLATFNDFGAKAIYELINLTDGKTISSGSLKAIPYAISWSDDEQLVAITFNKGNPGCFNVKGTMKEIFTCSMEGQAAFSRNRNLIAKSETLLYVFGDESVNSYTTAGKLKDSVEKDNDYKTYSMAWFDLLNNRFNLLNESDGEIATFSTAGKPGAVVSLPGVSAAADISDRAVDKDGSRFLCFNKEAVLVFDLTTGKNILRYPSADINAACFAPDSKAVMCIAKGKFLLIGMDGKLIASVDMEGYYSSMAYAGFGTELVSINPAGADIYSCKNYLPVNVASKTPAKVEPNEVKTQPVITKGKPVQEPVAAKWGLPYTATDFITPLTRDSFYLYNNDRSIRYYIVYKKGESSLIWKNPYEYFQYFGMSNQEKFPLGYIYTYDMSDAEAKVATYWHSVKPKGEMMFGGGNFVAKIPAKAGQSVSWTNTYYGEQSTLTAKVIDNVYKGKKAKCLVVNRTATINGTTVTESYYYQQGVGLVKIESGGKAFER